MSYNRIKNNKLNQIVDKLTSSKKSYYKNVLDQLQIDNFQQQPLINYNIDKSFYDLSLSKILKTGFKNRDSKNLNTRNKTQKSIDTRNESQKSIDTRNKTQKSIDTRNETQKSIDTRNEMQKSIDTRKEKTKIPKFKIKKSSKNKGTIIDKDDCFSSNIFYNITTDIGINIFKNYQNIRITHTEPALAAFCSLIYDKFLILQDDLKLQFMKQLKYKMGLDLDKKDLYKKFGYNHKRFKKSEFQSALVLNEPINEDKFNTYLGDYFDLNFIVYDNKQLKYLNNYDSERNSVVLVYYNNSYYSHCNLDYISIVNNTFIKTLEQNDSNSNSNKKDTDIKSLLSLKLDELQNMAKSKNIKIMKNGKSGLIKRTKKELANDIINI